ncbi:MAG: thrombospondin type 3 repeat-containing protein [Myxococcales bacterium]|nr:thrombospondin type 3 repeat-containing protein [Myxococcales bacterium]
MRQNIFAYVLTLTVALLAIENQAGAQGVPSDKFSANRFAPAPGADNYFMVDGSVLSGHLTPTAGLLIDYSHRPFVLYTASCDALDANGDATDCEIVESERDIVSYQLTMTPMATLTIKQRFQIGLTLPLVGTGGDSFTARTTVPGAEYVDIRGGDAFGMGDPRLSAKVRIVGKGREGFGLGAVAYLAAPLGELTAEGRGLGDETVSGGGHLIAEFRKQRLAVAANLGGSLRPSRELLSTESGPEFLYGVAASFEATPLVRAIVEFTGASQFTAQIDENPIEGRLGGEISVGDFAIRAGAGAGLLSGVGVPVFRVLAGINYQPHTLDSDGDGVGDKSDACPTEMEDQDGYLDDDGCPDLDNDGDGIDDTADRCPDEAEDPDGNEDQDGCPDRDNDGDGIEDGYDSCPEIAEDKDGDRDEDGCPDDDRDRDGVPDAADKCPDEPEDTDGFGDDDGCPETDFDGDGIADEDDHCPDEPETVNEVDDEDGCPETDGAAAPEGDAAAPAGE